MEEADDESAAQACILCDGHSTKWYSLRSWIRIATIRSILKEHVPARAQEFDSSSGFICARCYHAMDNLVRKKQEAAEAENFVQFLAKQTPTKQELDSDAETEQISERETSTPPNITGNDKGSESGTKNASTMTQITVTQTRSGREYTKRKLLNTENTVPEKVKKVTTNDCKLQASQDKLGKLTPSQTQSTINPTSPGVSSSINDLTDEGTKGKQGRGRPRKYPTCSPADEMSRKTGDVSEKTSEKRGRGRPKKYSPDPSSPETSKHVQKVISGTSEKRGRGRPRMYLIQAPASGAAKIEIKVSSADSVKHGRGRPRKLSIERPSSETPSTAEKTSISTTPKRGRGRPSKLSRGGQTETSKTSSELHENSLLFHRQLVKREENRDNMGQDINEGRETLINEDSSNTRFPDTGDITSDHSYHAGSPRVLGQKHVEIDHLSDVPNDSESENEDFSDDMDEDYVPDKDGHHNTSEKKSSTVTNPLDHMLGQRMTTRIRSGAIDRRVVVVGRKKEREKSILGKKYSSSMKEKSIFGKRSALRQNKNSNGSQKKLTFLNACNLQELPAKKMEKEKRVIPLHKAKKMAERKRKAKTKQYSVNPEIWSCKQCEAVEYSETDIRNHVRTEHNLCNDEEIEEKFSKKIVNLITPKGMNTSVQEELLSFLKTKEVTSYTCLICELKMRTENNALTHVRMTHCKSKEDAPSCIKRNIALVSVDNQQSDNNGKPSKKTAEQRNTERRNRRRAMMCV
ncbi:putative leucine-rich repeat-containing protein DDB_G0290503 [Argopecten irradians]|uniref:putative leucine-rich repeat-containing protein DDB_G0290503 n=1 Tax=Argopecten irradians TaxID=31199 RepID=UPI00371CF051